MNILDENIPRGTRDLLSNWHIRTRQIGRDIGLQGMQDEEIIRLLHDGPRVTFYTRDRDFHKGNLCHRNYCLVFLDVDVDAVELAQYVRRLQGHPLLDTQAKRMGKVIKVTTKELELWKVGAGSSERIEWPEQQ